jgi:pimeloyl-ACP methyl ester carboxylesterase
MATEPNRATQTLEADGFGFDYVEAGAGNPIVVFRAQDDDWVLPLLTRSAELYRVISLRPSSGDHLPAGQLAEKIPRALARIGIERCSLIAVSTGARPALALANAAPESIDKLILLSPLQISAEGAEVLDLAAIKAATLVLVGTRDKPEAIEAGRLCRERIASCHLSLVYGAEHALTSERPQAGLDPILQFLEQGEQFIIFRESQAIRP